MVLTLVSFWFCFAQPNQGKYYSSNKTEQEILGIERKWADAYLHHDADFISSIIADDFLGEKKILKTWLEDIKSYRLVKQSIEHENLQLRIFGDTAVLRGYANIKGNNKGEHISGKYRFMDVFRKRKGHRLVIASQSVRVPAQ